MLALRRKRSETIRITLESGKFIWIKVLELSPSMVKFGLDAPPEIKIVRSELLPDSERFQG